MRNVRPLGSLALLAPLVVVVVVGYLYLAPLMGW